MVESVKWSHLPNKCLRAEHKKIRRRYLGGKVLSHYLKNGCVSKLLRQKFLSCFLRLKITTREEFTVRRLRCRRKLNRVDIPSAHCCLEQAGHSLHFVKSQTTS